VANETLLTLAVDIVSAHVSNNSVTGDQLPVLIRLVYDSLSGLGQEPDPIKDEREPAVSIRSSIKPDAVTCLECGRKMKMLKRHISTDHGLTPAEYRARWKLTSDYPMVAPDYAAKRKDLAMKIGLGRNPGRAVKNDAEKPEAGHREEDVTPEELGDSEA